MKKAVMILSLIVIGLASCGGGSSVVGTWQLDSVSGEELTDSEKEMTMTFNEDGSCERLRGGDAKAGTWKLSEDGKTLTISSDGSDDVMENLELTEDKLVFTERSDKITFKRI